MSENLETHRLQPEEDPTGDALRLLIVHGDACRLYWLPVSGVVTVGRSDECTVQIDHSSVSRRHVAITVGATLSIRELGSTNGTRVGGRRLDPEETIALSTGDMIEFGSGTVTAVVQGRARPSAGGKAEAAPAPVGDAMDRVRALCDRVALGTISVLVLGETGVGKEVLVARLHARSKRRDSPFLQLNCGAVTESLFESELFGYERGAFTGAMQAKPGLLETADGGTVFLDEVGELSLTMQVKLLRAIEQRQVTRVGGVKPKAIDVRFVAATNRNLAAEVERAAFRADLYFRLNGISLEIPPLRERRGEIAELAQTFVEGACKAGGLPMMHFSREALSALMAHRWPGNIRELKNVMERAVLLCHDGEITQAHLGLPEGPESEHEADDDEATDSASDRERIIDALARSAGNQSAAAKILEVSRRTLLKRLDKYGIARPQKGRR